MGTMTLGQAIQLLKGDGRFHDVYVMESTGDVVLETKGRKRGTRGSFTTIPMDEAVKMAEAMIPAPKAPVPCTDEATKEAFVKALELVEKVEELATWCQIRAEDAEARRLQAEHEEEELRIRAEEEAELARLIAEEEAEVDLADGLRWRKIHVDSAASGVERMETMNWFRNQGMNFMGEIADFLVSTGDPVPTSIFRDIAHGLHTVMGNEQFRRLAEEARANAAELERQEQERATDAEVTKNMARAKQVAQEARRGLIEDVTGEADSAEQRHMRAVADRGRVPEGYELVRPSVPVARFQHRGKRYARTLLNGGADEVAQLVRDISEAFGKNALKGIKRTLKIRWESA